MNKINKYSTLFLGLLAVGLCFTSCKKKNDFQGHDNFITTFTLKKGSTTFTAAITDSSIIIKAPDGFSLDSAQVTVGLSENATIFPDPKTVFEWDDESLFVVNAHDGQKKSYKYTVERSSIPVEGSVVLATQADVDAFGKQGITEITGNLIIGKPAGPDSITNLTALYRLKKIGYSLIIYPTFSATQIVGLDNLQSVGTDIQIVSVNNLVDLVLPALETAGSITVNTPLTEDIEFPRLTSLTKGLSLNAPLNALSLPDLSQVGGAITFTTDPSLGAALIAVISFPALNSAGSISIENFKQTTKLNLPVLTSTGDLKLTNLTALYNLSCPRLQTATGTITIPAPSKLTQISFPALSQAGGLSITNQTINAVEFPALTTISGDFTLTSASIDGIRDFTALTTVKGLLHLEDLPNMNGFSLPAALKNIGTLAILNNNVAPPPTVNVKGLTIGEIQILVKGTLTLVGDDVFKGTLTVIPTISGTFPTLNGFSEIDSLSLGTFISSMPDLQIKGIKKINKSFLIPNNNVRTVGLPDLQEVGGNFTINQFQSVTQATIEIPALTKVGGNLSVLVQSPSVSTLKFTTLASVGGDFQVETGYTTRSLTTLSFPALTTIGGKLKVYSQIGPSYNTKMTSLDGFAALTSAKSIEVSGQKALTSFMGLQKVFPSISAAGWTVANNAYNPTYVNLQNGQWTKP